MQTIKQYTAFRLPSGNVVPTHVYVGAWKKLKTTPADESITGWNWYPVPAHEVLAAMRKALDDRINLRAGPRRREVSSGRLLDKIMRAWERGAIIKTCKWCGRTVMPDMCDGLLHRSGFCSPECLESYYN